MGEQPSKVADIPLHDVEFHLFIRYMEKAFFASCLCLRISELTVFFGRKGHVMWLTDALILR